MKKLIPILVFLFASLYADGQNWNPLNPGAVNYFVNNYGYVKAMRIDSLVAYGNQLHYYPYRRFHFGSDGYYNFWGYPDQDTVGSWLGGDVTRKSDGTFLFPNYWNDTIKIRTLASVGDTWTFYQRADSVYYIAEVTALDTMTVLGLVDSVRRITLSAFENGVAVLSDSFDHTELVLSKAHGFCSALDLYFFPFYEPGNAQPFDDYYTVNSLRTHDGFMNWIFDRPGKHGCIFKIFDVGDLAVFQPVQGEVGDVTQYGACFPATISFSQCGGPYTTSYDSIISKAVYNNGVEYVREGWRAMPVYEGMTTHILSYTITPYRDTVFVADSVNMIPVLGIPEEMPNYWGDPRGVYYYVVLDTTYCSISPALYSLRYSLGLSSNAEKHIAKAGLGAVSDWSYNYFDSDTRIRYNSLGYIRKSGFTCGNYFVPDTTTPVPNATVNVNEGSSIKIYPNPASEQLTIETSLSGYKLSLVNAVGQVVYSKDGCDNKQIVDVGAFAAGVYQLRIETAGHE